MPFSSRRTALAIGCQDAKRLDDRRRSCPLGRRRGVGLSLLDPDMPGLLRVVASQGIPPESYEEVMRGAVGAGAGGLALAEYRVIVIEDYPNHPLALPPLAELGVRAAAAAPVRQDGVLVGRLEVASTAGKALSRDGARGTRQVCRACQLCGD